MELVGRMRDVWFGIKGLRLDDVDGCVPIDSLNPEGGPLVRAIGSACGPAGDSTMPPQHSMD
jgi:hypothetical protein